MPRARLAVLGFLVGSILPSSGWTQTWSAPYLEPYRIMTLDVPDRVFFAANDVALTPESRKTIGYWASVLLEHPGSVTIEGHADEPPDDEVALELSARRATVVRQALIELGVPAASLKMRAYGNARPIIITDGHLTVSENRRAVLTHLPPS